MSLLGKLQFWTLKDNVFVKDDDIGAYTLHDKNENYSQLDHPYMSGKELYTNTRGIDWTPRNKRPDKVRDTLKELEETLLVDNCVAIQWLPSRLNLFFNSGLLATVYTVSNNDCCNIERIVFDRHLVGKIATDHVTDAIREDTYILVAYGEPKMTYIYFGKKTKKSEKLSALDPKLVTVDLIGPIGRRLDRRLSLSSLKDKVLVWWSTRNGEVWPWMPTTSDRERANLVVYALGESSLELVSFSRTEGELVSAMFSRINPNQLLTVEEHINKLESISINVCAYHVSRGRFLRSSLTTVPLQGHVVCCQWSPAEDRLFLACSDMSVVLFDSVKQISKLTIALFPPIEVAWHPGGSIVVLASEKGHLQCFDIGLSCVKIQLLSDDIQPVKKLELSSYFRSQPALLRLIWEGSERNDIHSNVLCIMFDKGPISMLSLTLGMVTRGLLSPNELVSEYIKNGLVDEAICILHNLHWNQEAEICYRIILNIVNFLLRKTFNQDREAQLEATLGFFYDTTHPLPEGIIEEYREQVGRLARRFFHHLLRHDRLEKAFLLAVDLGCRDLFLDLHNIAEVKGEKTLADVALSRANQLDTLSMASSTSCESESTEEDYSELSEEDLADQKKAIFPQPPNSTLAERAIFSGSHEGDLSVRPKQYSNHPDVPLKPVFQPLQMPFVLTEPKMRFQLKDLYHQESTLMEGLELQLPPPSTNRPPLVPRISDMKLIAPTLPPRRSVQSSLSEHQIRNFENQPTPLNNSNLTRPINGFPNRQQVYFETESHLQDCTNDPNKTVNEKEIISEDEEIENTRIQFVHFGVV